MADYEEEEEVTVEEKQAIAKHFLMRCPPGEQKAFVKDLKSLLGDVLDDATVTENLQSRAMKYNDFPAKTRVVCHAKGQVDGGFVDPATGKVHDIDFEKMESKDTSGGDDFEDEPLRAAVDAEMQKYMKEHYLNKDYADNACAVFGGDELTCVLSAKNSSLSNFWTGCWRSTYTLNGSKVSGVIKVQVHYFEQGNVQLNTKFEAEKDVASSDDEAVMATNIVKAIKEMENGFQTELSNFFTTSTASFKKVRRGLTIQGTLFDWRLSLHENVGMMSN